MSDIITPQLQAVLDAAEEGSASGWYIDDRRRMRAALADYNESIRPKPFKAWLHRETLDSVSQNDQCGTIWTFNSEPCDEAWEIEVTPIRRIK